MRAPLSREKFRKPELFLSELLRKSAQGRLSERDDNSRVFYRAVVVAVDVNGGRLENSGGDGKLTHVIGGKAIDVPATVGPPNPRNSVKARIVTEGFDQFISDSRLRVFWPFFDEHVSIPIKPGEHVYVLFEDEGFQHGLWFSKVSGHENTNQFQGEKSYLKAGTGLAGLFPETTAPSSEPDLNTDIDASEVLAGDGRLTALMKL